MTETQPVKNPESNEDIYSFRILESGGKLIIFWQAHEDSYRPATIQKDIEDVHPKALILENARVVSDVLSPQQRFIGDVIHQFGVARELNIPVVLGDVTGAYYREDAPRNRPIFKLTQNESSNVTDLNVNIGIGGLAIGGTFELIALMAAAYEAIKTRSVSRRDFIKLAAATAGSAAIAATPIARAILALRTAEDITAVTGHVNQSIDTKSKAMALGILAFEKNLDTSLLKLWYEIRNIKFIEMAELASQYSQNKLRTDPKTTKIGLVAGAGHGLLLDDTSKYPIDTRDITIENFIEKTFIPTHHNILATAGTTPQEKRSIVDLSVLDLANLSVAGVYDVTDTFSTPSPNPPLILRGYLISETIVNGIERGLEGKPELAVPYTQKVNQLRANSLL